MVTRRCNMTCSHCSVESAPRVGTPDPAEAELLRIIRESAAAGVEAVQFTGGEPMIRQKLIHRLMKETHRLKMASGLTTNGFWGKNPRAARATLKQMIRQGLLYLTVSYDRYHAEFMGPQPILNIAAAARHLGFHFNLNITRTLHDENLDEYARLFGNLPNVRMRLYDVQPVGRARNFDMPELRAETEGFCNAATQATFTEDGRVIACNGPSYFDNATSPRHVGNAAAEPIAALLQRHWSDPILDTIRTSGPAGLRNELKKDARFAGSFDRRFAGQCDLCHHITGNSEMVGHLSAVLADSRHGALRAARWSMINAAKASGELSREHINGPGAAAIFYQRATTGAWPANAEVLLGRADIDWDHLAGYLGGSGVAPALATAAAQQLLSRWAPPYFAQSLQKRALADALRELSHRETLEKIHEELVAMGLRGILLKGAALYLRERAAGLPALRIPGDIDLWVENPAAADTLRRRLIVAGFTGKPDAPRTGPHHLAPVHWRHSAIEIHTGIMPSFWGLPENTMAADAMPISGWSAYHTLSPEDMILHEAVHSTTHLYSFGLKLAVDIFRINRLAKQAADCTPAEPGGIDWQSISDRVATTRCPDAFWVPTMALDRGLPGLLPIPHDFLAKSPADRRSKRMRLVAGKRLFTATDNADAMNPFTRNGIFLLLHNGPVSRLRYLAEIAHGDAAESRRAAMATGSQSWKHLPAHLRSAWHDLQAYRRAASGQHSRK